MIEIYKILSGKYDTNVVANLKTTGIQATRGNDLRMCKTRFKYDLRKFYFTNIVVDAWNSLLNWIVMANSTNTYKHRLDIYWQDQEIMCTVTGNRNNNNNNNIYKQRSLK